MLPAPIQLKLNPSSSTLVFPNKKLLFLKNPVFTNPNHSSLLPSNLKITRKLSISASSALAHETSAHDFISSTPPKKQKLGVVVKPMEKPRLVLKFIWMEKNIGITIDQVIPGHGTIPLSPYYFWPRKDAWEELKVMLDNKPWISQKDKVILLNQATDIINLWQQSGGGFA